MAFFRRGKKTDKKDDGASEGEPSDADSGTIDPDAGSPQRVGVVSGVLSSARAGDGETLFADIVERRFGPTAAGHSDSSSLPPRYESGREDGRADSFEDEVDRASDDPVVEDSATDARESYAEVPTARRDHLRAVEPLFSDHPAAPDLEVDPMANIGRATTITGNIVAEEDLEIQGTIEGSIRLVDHQLTVGNDGSVKANVEANVVMVYGRVTGNVVATEMVEVEKGGIVGGDIKAPRIIMHDGAIVVGGLDMSAALPKGAGSLDATEGYDVIAEPVHLKPVEARDADFLEGEEV
jgi:cytoskeletal protein CcmA (bactofilin family)